MVVLEELLCLVLLVPAVLHSLSLSSDFMQQYFLISGLNPICLHSQDVIMVEEIRREKNWVKYEGGGRLYM